MRKIIALAITAQVGLMCSGLNFGLPGFKAIAASAKSEEAYGYIDRNGKMVIPPDFDEAGPFSEGLAAVKVGDKYGFVDKTGVMKIEPRFSEAEPFKEGLAAVVDASLDEKLYGFVDKEGKFVIEPAFEDAHCFQEGVAAVKFTRAGDISYDTQWGYIDKTGKTIIKPQFSDANEFNKGLAIIQNGQHYGVIDRDGAFLVKPSYQLILQSPDNTLTYLKLSGKVMGLTGMGHNWIVTGGLFGFLDSHGKTIIKPTYDGATSFSEGLACVASGATEKDGRPRTWTYIDTNGNTTIDGKYSLGLPFSEGLAPVAKGRWQMGMAPSLVAAKWGFIDKKGKVVVPLTFDDASPYVGGMARVVSDDKTGFLDHNGKIAIEPKYSDADDFSEDLAAVKTERAKN
ncbi:MAG: WG repeat-containing protein [Candidatus Obscuribacterales bacterium]|nr:WG repeat-containing protein [Candidatus Obscuribacterales bacterium]